MQFDIAYFSGTGNTLDAVQSIREVLLRAGHQCLLTDIEMTMPASAALEVRECNANRTLILAFPVYSWAPPSLVLRWIRCIPDGRGRGAVVLAVDGGDGKRATVPAARALSRRGYTVHLTARIGYPENWTQIIPPNSPVEAASVLDSGRRAARRVAEDLLAGVSRRYAPGGVLPRVLSLVGLLFRSVARRLLGQLYVADARCTSCRLCERSCPVGAISLRSGSHARPRWRPTCESCNRCINICPTGAINTSWFRILAMILGVTALSILHIRLGRAAVGDLWNDVWAIRAVVGVILVIVAHFVYLALAPILFFIEHRRLLRRLTYASFTRRYHRYTAPGYSPPARG